MMAWPPLRILLNLVNCLLDLGMEIQTQSRHFGFVMGDGVIPLGLRLRMDDDRFHEYFARNSRTTFSAGAPPT